MSHDVTIMTCCCFFLLTAHAQTAVKMCADGKCPHRRDCTLWREYALCRLNGAMKRASRRVGPVRRAGTSCVKYSELAQDVLNLAVIKVYNVINEGASGRVYNDYMQYLCNFEVRVYYGEKNRGHHHPYHRRNEKNGWQPWRENGNGVSRKPPIKFLPSIWTQGRRIPPLRRRIQRDNRRQIQTG